MRTGGCCRAHPSCTGGSARVISSRRPHSHGRTAPATLRGQVPGPAPQGITHKTKTRTPHRLWGTGGEAGRRHLKTLGKVRKFMSSFPLTLQRDGIPARALPAGSWLKSLLELALLALRKPRVLGRGVAARSPQPEAVVTGDAGLRSCGVASRVLMGMGVKAQALGPAGTVASCSVSPAAWSPLPPSHLLTSTHRSPRPRGHPGQPPSQSGNHFIRENRSHTFILQRGAITEAHEIT